MQQIASKRKPIPWIARKRKMSIEERKRAIEMPGVVAMVEESQSVESAVS